jgi:multidrug efflux pump subunit AcrA (membrane-fusion protein)
MSPSSLGTSGRTYFAKTKTYVVAHKIRSAIIAVILIGGGYWLWGVTHPTVTQTRYVLTTVSTGTIVSSVSESGQVSPSNQVTINPQASGQVTEVLVKNGQEVSTGEPIAYLNATDEYNAVESAKASLESSQLNLQKLQEPATALQLTQDQDSVTKAQANLTTDENNLANDYTSSYSDIVSTYLDLPSIQTQLQDIVTGTEASRGAQWNIDFYENATENWDDLDAISGRTNTYNAYIAANAAYTKAYADFQTISPSSSTSTINATLNETYATTQTLETALNAANSFIQFYENEVKNNSQTPSSEAVSSISTLATDISKIDSHLSALLSDQNQITATEESITNDASTITESQETLQQLQSGADPLDIQSDQLNIQQQQNALQRPFPARLPALISMSAIR